MATDRRIGVAMDFSEGSKMALKWVVKNLLDKEDRLYLIHVQPSEGKDSRNILWLKNGAPVTAYWDLPDSELLPIYGVKFDRDVLDMIRTTSKKKEVMILVKIYWGDARDKLCEAVGELKLDCLVMGSRGLGTIQRIMLGSVTSHVIANATSAVTIVKN